jgi:dihydrofolate reductase
MTEGAIVLYIATSVDGYVATEDGGVKWLKEFESGATDAAVEDYEAFFASVDALIMGARTYEQVLTFGEWPYEDRPTYVLAHDEHPRATEAITFVDDDVGALAARLRDAYDRVWLVGGAQVAQSFLRERAVDELRLSLVPVLLGSGIPLFERAGEQQRLRLRGTTSHETGIVELRYDVTP